MKNMLPFILLISFSNYPMHQITTSGDQSIDIPDMVLTEDEEKAICNRIMHKYFEQHSNLTPHIEPFIRERIRTRYDVVADRSMFDSSDIGNKHELHELILESMTEALKKESEQRQSMCNKHTSAAIAALTGCLTTTITSIIALLIHLNSQDDCDK